MTFVDSNGCVCSAKEIAVPISFVRDLFALWNRLEQSNSVFERACGEEIGKCADFDFMLDLEAVVGRFQELVIDADEEEHELHLVS